MHHLELHGPPEQPEVDYIDFTKTYVWFSRFNPTSPIITAEELNKRCRTHCSESGNLLPN